MVDTNNLAHDFIAYRFHGFHRSATVAGWAFVTQYVLNAFAGAFTRHLHQPQRRKTINAGFHPVFAQRLIQRVQHSAAVIFIIHIDEINNDNPAQITQP